MESRGEIPGFYAQKEGNFMMTYEIFKEVVTERFKDYLSKKYQDMDMLVNSMRTNIPVFCLQRTERYLT